MLTRRGFAGFASCAICAVTGFVATDASAAEGALPGVTPGVTWQEALSGNRWRRVARLPIARDTVHAQLRRDCRRRRAGHQNEFRREPSAGSLVSLASSMCERTTILPYQC